MSNLWSNFSPNVLIVILGVFLIGVLLFVYRKSIEGFEADISGVKDAVSQDNWRDSAAESTVTAALGLSPPTDNRQYVADTSSSPPNPQLGSAIASIVATLPRPSAATSTTEANVPEVAQSSMVPSDTGAASSANPLFSTPQPTDVASTMESLANFKLLAEKKGGYTTNMDLADVQEVQKLSDLYPQFQNELLSAAADPTTTSLSVGDLNAFRDHLNTITNTLRNASMKGGVDYSGNNNLSSAVTTVATPSDTLNLNDLQNLKMRTQAESLKLANLRSTSSTITQRKNTLDNISSDINDMIVKLQNGQMNPKDIPITQDAANAFLASLSNSQTQLPSLMQPLGNRATTDMMPNIYNQGAAAPTGGNAVLTQLLNNAQYLKWNVDLSVGFDPNVAVRGRMLDRLEQIEKTLTNMVISETPPTPELYKTYRKEMETIQRMLDSQNTDDGPKIDVLPTSYTRFDTEPMYPPMGMPEPDSALNMRTDSLPAQYATGTLPNGRVGMVGPSRVGSDGRVQLQNVPSAVQPGCGNYGQAQPSDRESSDINAETMAHSYNYYKPSTKANTAPISKPVNEQQTSCWDVVESSGDMFLDLGPLMANLMADGQKIQACFVGLPTSSNVDLTPAQKACFSAAGTYFTLDEAKAACAADPKCTAILSFPAPTDGKESYRKYNGDVKLVPLPPPQGRPNLGGMKAYIKKACVANSPSVQSNTSLFALPLSYGAVTPDLVSKTTAPFAGQASYNAPTVPVNVAAMYRVPPTAEVPVYMTAYAPALPGVSAVAAGGQASQPAGYMPVKEGFTSSSPTFPYAGPQPDSNIRPGFAMNDDTIARRASASAFDPSKVGGADYKQRAQDLCAQVGKAGLAPPGNFGCIDKPDEVSPDYSWKGNYNMVCNRLGDTWGGWYPEMVGCPTPNPTAKFQGQ